MDSAGSRGLAGLPAPVARYFRHTLNEGQRIITHARITWDGQFNRGQPGKDNWRPFTAVREFVPGAPGFVWNARITMLPGVPIFVRDSFVDDRGSIRVYDDGMGAPVARPIEARSLRFGDYTG